MSDAGGEVFLAFIKDLVDSQEARKASLEQRGLAVITTSGVLATLLFGLVGIITKPSSYVLPAASHLPLRVALALFAAAALGGVIVNAPMPYKGIAPGTLRNVVKSFWTDYTTTEAQQMVSISWLDALTSAKHWNRVKAYSLVVAQSLQVGALGFLAWALSIVVGAHTGPHT